MRFCSHRVDLYGKGPRDTTGFSKSDVLIESQVPCRVEQVKRHQFDAAGQRDVNVRKILVFMEPKTGRNLSPESTIGYDGRRYKVERVDPEYSLSRLDHLEILAVETEDGL